MSFIYKIESCVLFLILLKDTGKVCKQKRYRTELFSVSY